MRRLCIFLSLFFTLHLAAQQYRDSLSVLCIGNSFTYVDSAHIKLQQIAASQQHYIQLDAQLVGGYTFKRHLVRDQTMGTLVYHQFDCVFLQDQSRTPAVYAENMRRGRVLLDDARELVSRVRVYSPKARIWLEQTWAYEQGNYGGFGSWEHFDELLRKGTRHMARKTKTEVSPIGEAFSLCRQEHPEIHLYDADCKHQSAYGSYLKACVNYLLIYGQPFTGVVACCGLDAEQCAVLQQIAMRVVL